MHAETSPYGKLLMFALLSGLDLFLTWHLLEQRAGQVYESNPIARWWLEQHGWLGLVFFKSSVVLVVAGLALLISRYRPRTGGWVLVFACSTLALVVLYSSSLAGFMCRQPEVVAAGELEHQAERDRLLDQRLHAIREYNALLGRLGDDWLAGRCTLSEAVRQLAGTSNARNPSWLQLIYQRYPGHTTEQCLAANLLDHVRVSQTHSQSVDPQVLSQLAAEYQARYGVIAPCRFTSM